MALTAAQACKQYGVLATADEQYWQSNLQDIYDYAMPYRQAAGHDGRSASGKSPGDKRTTKIYDATAVVAAPRGAGKMKRALTPDFEQWLLLVPGPLVDPGQKTRLAKELESTTAILWAVFAGSSFSAAADGMYLDLYAGQGCMMVLKGDESELVRFVSVSAEKMIVDNDSYGNLRAWWYPVKVVNREIVERWPDAKIHKDLAQKIQDEPETETELILHCWRNGPRDFTWRVLWKEKNHGLVEESMRSCPFITPRFFVVPGEKRGRGPLMLAMPHIKTLNKAVEMQLQAGAFALLGAWMTSDDQLYHPRKTALVPGGMVKVKRTGGPLGASLARLPVAENFDLGAIVIDELRMQIKEMLHDTPLPAETGSVRSPTEIVARLQRLSEDISGAFGRLHAELFRPLVERVVDVLQQWDLISENITIDDYIMKVQILSPLANTQMIDEIQKTVRFYEILVSTVGVKEARTFIDTDAWAVFLHERMGITAQIVREPEKRAAMREMDQQMMMMAAQAGIAPPDEGAEEASGPSPMAVAENGAMAA